LILKILGQLLNNTFRGLAIQSSGIQTQHHAFVNTLMEWTDGSREQAAASATMGSNEIATPEAYEVLTVMNQGGR
jgi:hypothetical protein